jgi:transcriptional regulator GlxA family with amidase domain
LVVTSWDEEGLLRLVDVYLSGCFKRRTQAHVTELAASVPVRRTHLTAVFRQKLRRSPLAVLHEAQVKEAKRLLAMHAYSFEEVAVRSGFGTRLTLHRVFLSIVGVSPTEYRDKNGQIDTGL